MSALDRSGGIRIDSLREDQLIVEPLVIALTMVVGDELLNGTA